jgi:hypothetical protein
MSNYATPPLSPVSPVFLVLIGRAYLMYPSGTSLRPSATALPLTALKLHSPVLVLKYSRACAFAVPRAWKWSFQCSQVVHSHFSFYANVAFSVSLLWQYCLNFQLHSCTVFVSLLCFIFSLAYYKFYLSYLSVSPPVTCKLHKSRLLSVVSCCIPDTWNTA